MISGKATILKFNKKGEKSGWSYIEISPQQAHKLKPGCLVAFRVKGTLDNYPIEKTTLLPMGDGAFILPINGSIRKATGKKAGDVLMIRLECDDRVIPISKDLLVCLKEDTQALQFFKKLPNSHQQYFSKWIESAKTISTKTKRITMAVMALSARQGFSEMIRANKGTKQKKL